MKRKEKEEERSLCGRPRPRLFHWLSLLKEQTGSFSPNVRIVKRANFFFLLLLSSSLLLTLKQISALYSSTNSSFTVSLRCMKMSVTSLILITTITLEVLPAICHKLITHPYQDQEYESVVISSDPIKIRERKSNETASLKQQQILKPQGRSFKECPQNDFKCLYSDEIDFNRNNQIIDKFLKQYSNIADVKYAENLENHTETLENGNAGKSYWSMIHSQTHHHPYDDKKGWVTLEPVPWSTSKISKWHPTKLGVLQENKPWSYGSSNQQPVQQFWVSGSSLHNQKPATQWGIGSNDIITDNRPSNFPSPSYNGNNVNKPLYGTEYHNSNGYYEQSGYNAYQQNHGYHGNYPPKHSQNIHPSTYPESGNGEWVLLSTTKGYSFPQRHRWGPKTDERSFSSRKVKPTEISRYHEEDLNDKYVLVDKNSEGNKKSDENPKNDEKYSADESLNSENSEKNLVQVLYTGKPKGEEAVKTIRRKVRLQVLPALENSSTSYGGLLEVDASSQTVDEAQQEDEKLQKLKAIANVKKGKIRGYKLLPVNKVSGKGMTNNAMTLAAVGAGMIPATMALLVPMALGRRRRSLQTEYLDQNQKNKMVKLY